MFGKMEKNITMHRAASPTKKNTPASGDSTIPANNNNSNNSNPGNRNSHRGQNNSRGGSNSAKHKPKNSFTTDSKARNPSKTNTRRRKPHLNPNDSESGLAHPGEPAQSNSGNSNQSLISENTNNNAVPSPPVAQETTVTDAEENNPKDMQPEIVYSLNMIIKYATPNKRYSQQQRASDDDDLKHFYDIFMPPNLFCLPRAQVNNDGRRRQRPGPDDFPTRPPPPSGSHSQESMGHLTEHPVKELTPVRNVGNNNNNRNNHNNNTPVVPWGKRPDNDVDLGLSAFSMGDIKEAEKAVAEGMSLQAYFDKVQREQRKQRQEKNEPLKHENAINTQVFPTDTRDTGVGLGGVALDQAVDEEFLFFTDEMNPAPMSMPWYNAKKAKEQEQKSMPSNIVPAANKDESKEPGKDVTDWFSSVLDSNLTGEENDPIAEFIAPVKQKSSGSMEQKKSSQDNINNNVINNSNNIININNTVVAHHHQQQQQQQQQYSSPIMPFLIDSARRSSESMNPSDSMESQKWNANPTTKVSNERGRAAGQQLLSLLGVNRNPNPNNFHSSSPADTSAIVNDTPSMHQSINSEVHGMNMFASTVPADPESRRCTGYEKSFSFDEFLSSFTKQTESPARH